MVDVPEHKRRVAFHVLTGSTPKEGVLKARRYREEKEQSTWFTAVDFLLGDDEYIFLTLDQPLSLAYSFIPFDVEELIKAGAGVRVKDIMRTRAYVAFDKEYREVKFEEKRETGHGLLPINFVSVEELQRLLRKYPALKHAFEVLSKTRNSITYWGEDAMLALKSCPVVEDEGGCEILVPKELPLSRQLEPPKMSSKV